MSEMKKIRKNQKVITINKETTFDKGTKYLVLSEESIIAASKYMMPNTKTIWEILMMNQNGFEWILSPAYFKNTYGMDKKTVHTAIKDLIGLGYLEQTDNEGIFYTLHSWVDIDDDWFKTYKSNRNKKKEKEVTLDDDIDDYEI